MEVVKSDKASEIEPSKSKQKTDPFIIYLIELSRTLTDENKRKNTINDIIIKNKLYLDDIQLLIEVNKISIENESDDPLFINTLLIQTNINRCKNAVSLNLKSWKKINNQLSEEIKDNVFSLDWFTTSHNHKHLPYTHLVSDLLCINHKTKIVKLGEIIIHRYDLHKDVPNKDFDPYDPSTYTYSPTKEIQNIKDVDIDVCPLTNSMTLFILQKFVVDVDHVEFIKIPSITKRKTILGVSFISLKVKMLFIPKYSILVYKDTITQFFLLNVVKKKNKD
ncbi:hypothetical protein NUSPORA_02796 [Nucleospora cyclopteri]